MNETDKAELARLLRHGEDAVDGQDGESACGECGGDRKGHHTPTCRLGQWLLELGGEAEQHRQVEAAHEEAHREQRLRNEWAKRGKAWPWPDGHLAPARL